MLTLDVVQRSLVWAVLGVIVLAGAAFATSRLLGRVNDDRNPTIIGGLALVEGGRALGSVPIFLYVGDTSTRTAALSMAVVGGPQETVVRVLLSNIVPGTCAPNQVTMLSEPHPLGIDTAFYSQHQAHQRTMYAVDFIVPARARIAGIACNVSDPPERETYTTRRIAFAPPLNPDIEQAATEGARFAPVWPVVASIQRVTESTGFNTSGGERVHNDTLASLTEAVALTRQDPVLRAFWTDERARSWQTFWLFFWAASASLGFGLLVEAVRPFIDRIGLASGGS